MKYLQLITLLGFIFFAQTLQGQSGEKVYEITITTTDKAGNKEVKEMVVEGEDLSQDEIDAMIKEQLDGTEAEVDVNVNVNVSESGDKGGEQVRTITKIIKQRSNLHDEEKIIIDETDMEIEVIDDKVYINGEEVKEGDFGDKKVRILKFEEGDDYDLEKILEDEDIEIGKDEKVYFIETEESNEGVAFLGVTVGKSIDGGVGIRGVVKGTSAEQLGLKEGDVLMSIDGNKVIGYTSLSKIIKSYVPGETVKLVYARNGKMKEANVALSDYEKFNDNTAYAWKEKIHHKKNRKDGKQGHRRHRNHDANRATLGVQVDDQLVVTKVVDESAAQKSGLQVGDKILKVNKAKMLSMGQFQHTIKAHQIGDEVKLKIERNGKKKSANATLQKMKPRARKHRHNVSSRKERIVIKDKASAQKRAALESSGVIKVREFSLSPNPSNGKLNVSFEMDRLVEGESIAVRIISLDGKVIEESTIDELDGLFEENYDLTNSPEGIYLFQVEKNAQTFTKRFVIGRE